MTNWLVGGFVRTERAVGANTTAWAQGQAEFLGAVVTAGQHPHLAATVQDLTPPTAPTTSSTASYPA